jgi:L-iditol 2-dehydrogenase
VTFEQAALLEPTAVALHAVKRIEIDGVVKAAVTGNGAIGRLTGAWLQHYGAGIVEVLGRNDKNLCESYDVCFEAAGTAEAFRRCIELARPNGDVVLIGNPGVDFKIEQNLYWKILRKQLTVAGIWNSRYPSDWLTALENVNNLHPEHFISHKYKFEELDQALDMMYSKREKHGRAIITVN